MYESTGSCLDFHNSRQLWFPLVAILNELLFVVEKLLVQECRVLKVGTFNNRINGASLLAESTEDALRHIDIVLGRATRAIGSWLRFNLDSKGGASCFAQFAGDASFLTGWVATQCVLSTEHGTERSLLPRVMKHVIGLEG